MRKESHMFIIKKKRYVRKTLRISAELLKRLGDIANKKGVPINSLVIQCCIYTLENSNKYNTGKSNATNSEKS